MTVGIDEILTNYLDDNDFDDYLDGWVELHYPAKGQYVVSFIPVNEDTGEADYNKSISWELTAREL